MRTAEAYAMPSAQNRLWASGPEVGSPQRLAGLS